VDEKVSAAATGRIVRPHGTAEGLRAAHLTLVVSFIMAVGWTAVAGVRGDPASVAAVLSASAAVLVIARLATTVFRLAAPTVVLMAAAAIAITSRHELLAHGPLSGPFGYANAKGAFFMVAAIAGLMIVVGSSNGAGRALGLFGAIGAALVAPAAHVVASSVLVVVIPLPTLLLAMAGRRAARWAIALCGSLLLSALVATVVLGMRDWDRAASSVETRLSTVLAFNRLELWHEAEQLMMRNPLRGIGPGRFGRVAPLALEDRSQHLYWAQNDFLQQGAEQGIPGFLLLIGVFVAAFVALWMNPDVDAFVALAAATLAVVGIQACVDYVLHFPAVALSTAALVGAGMASRPTRDPARAPIGRTGSRT
jgi:O-antigen ligase